MFWSYFKSAWKLSRNARYFAESDSDSFWTEEDARNTKLFFESVTGKKLGMRLSNFAIKMALAACQDSGAKNGDARGVTACIAAIEAHYPQIEEQPQAATTELDQMEVVEA
jgi:hypothetical protein